MSGLMQLAGYKVWNYPILYKEDAYTFWRVLRSLFSSSEHEWDENGEITTTPPPEAKISAQRHKEKLKEARLAWRVSEATGRLLGIERPPISIIFHMSDIYAIGYVPDNVTDEYLMAVLYYLEVIANAPQGWFYNRPAKVKGQYSYIPEEQKALATEYLASLKDRFANRL